MTRFFLYRCGNPSAQRRETDSRVEEGQPGLVRVKQINNHLIYCSYGKEYVLQIAQTIKEQLVGMTPAPVIMSWGITEFAATIYRDLPALRIKLNGRLHTGYVMIVLNGSDYYEVYLLSGSATECVSKEVCFDELGNVIDRAVESGTDQAEYEEFCRQQLGKLLSGQTA